VDLCVRMPGGDVLWIPFGIESWIMKPNEYVLSGEMFVQAGIVYK
jgi:hypothetical protein